MKSSAVSAGNRVAQFVVITAVLSVLYQLFIQRSIVASPSVTSSLNSGSHKSEDSRPSNITGFLLFLGLFGLLQHKKQQSKKADIEAEQKSIARNVQSQRKRLETGSFKVTNLPRDVLCELLLFLSPKELVDCSLVCKSWYFCTGDTAETLWRRVFMRDFDEPGDRFAKVFPIECWRHFYFRHHLSRAVELARLLAITDGRKCVAIEGQVYDVTDFLELHPGGPHVIGDAVGTDATLIWDQFQHSNEAKQSMQQFLVWDKVLARPESEKLHGNLEVVVTRWRKILWVLAHSHYFGRMTPTFADAAFHLNPRGATGNFASFL